MPHRDDEAQEENEANAKLIVNAVNNYESLLEACKEALSYLHEYIRQSGDDSDETMKHKEKLEQAVKQAEG
jgi:hypothetical protein